ncbi:MAG: hypothetical protein LBJ18_01425, partial [Rickettsiales bacterium]|nr:hypothetical protein [Rickettsiales bacterium]
MQKTVLIIDDDEMLRGALAKGLRASAAPSFVASGAATGETAKFNVITADSAESAAKILDRIIPDAIVLDRMMTGMDGLSFLQKIRAAGN